ncbi:hypothetical protein ABZW03_06160 [Kitasatospora sp. NPDC004799]
MDVRIEAGVVPVAGVERAAGLGTRTPAWYSADPARAAGLGG